MNTILILYVSHTAECVTSRANSQISSLSLEVLSAKLCMVFISCCVYVVLYRITYSKQKSDLTFLGGGGIEFVLHASWNEKNKIRDFMVAVRIS